MFLRKDYNGVFMVKSLSVSVIIAAYNEERTLASIIEIVRSWGKASEIIVVDDGSKDKTAQSVRHFVPGIKLIIHKKNLGKAAAIADGILQSTGEVLVLLDADTVGLTHKDLDIMATPVISGKRDMVLGLARFWSAGKFQPFNKLTGQRVLLRRYLGPNMSEMRGLGYGLELYLNKLFKKRRVSSVRLPHVFILGKFEKLSKQGALMSYVKELRDLLLQLVNQYADEVGPNAKKVVKKIRSLVSDITDILLS